KALRSPISIQRTWKYCHSTFIIQKAPLTRPLCGHPLPDVFLAKDRERVNSATSKSASEGS
ncbi:MAG: hypothetical protein WD065_19925, partial [Planctomycetaceae bacterium]